MSLDQRERILDQALSLMADQGAGSTSMRQLAKACDLNVAGIYHYFPSKADLLRSVIEERQYAIKLSELPDIALDVPPRDLLAGLVVEMWRGAQAEEQIWRLLLGEGLRGDETAVAVGRELLEAIEASLEEWIVRLFPEHADRTDAMVAIVTSQLLSFFVEQLFRPDPGDVRARAIQIADLVFPEGAHGGVPAALATTAAG